MRVLCMRNTCAMEYMRNALRVRCTPQALDLLTAQARDPARRQVRFQLPEEDTLVANLSEVRSPGNLCQDCAQRQSISG